MAPKPHLSITLPRNFEFHYTDGNLPRTPAPAPIEEMAEPPPPPKQTFKVRRRRVAEHVARDITSEDTHDLPTFEMTEADEEDEEISQLDSATTPGFLAPQPAVLPLLSPPKTPLSQTGTYDMEQENEWSMISSSQMIARPISACSSRSDSSTSSIGSSNSYPSLGGSLTSPESEAADPFSWAAPKITGPIFSPDLSYSAESPIVKRSKTSRHAKWSPEMDNHLWLTYMFYIQDPRVTPFKTLPGTAPPLGVCHRVAREAKHTWPRYRNAPLTNDDRSLRTPTTRGSSPDTVCPDRMDRGGSTTPVPADQYKVPAKWPRSEGATRRRLRELCKHKPSLSAHYQRLLKTRSPSPFQSSSPRSRDKSDPQSAAISSRDFNSSLSAATAPAMLLDPLMSPPSIVQVPAAPKAEIKPERPEGWYGRIGRSQAHQKSRSLQLSMGLGHGNGSPFDLQGPLASPFDRETNREDLLSSMSTTQSLGRNFGRKPETEATLNSPLELHAPVPTNRSLKRRFKLEEDIPEHASLQNLFSNAPHAPSQRPIARDRAFSLGAVQDGTRSLNSFFARPSVTDTPMSDAVSSDALPTTSNYLQPPMAPPARLGSPFGGASVAPHFNTFPRRFSPFGSEVSTHAFTPNTSLEATFRELARQKHG